MKRTVAKILTGLIMLTSAMALLAGCQGQNVKVPGGDDAFAAPVMDNDFVEGKELMCLAESQEAAEEIARQYGIQLVEFSYGVATFHTDDNPNDVIAMGKKLGYPELSLNRVMHTY